MNKASYKKNITKLATIEEARERYRLGRALLLSLAEENNALRRFSRTIRIDIEVLDKAIENY